MTRKFDIPTWFKRNMKRQTWVINHKEVNKVKLLTLGNGKMTNITSNNFIVIRAVRRSLGQSVWVYNMLGFSQKFITTCSKLFILFAILSFLASIPLTILFCIPYFISFRYFYSSYCWTGCSKVKPRWKGGNKFGMCTSIKCTIFVLDFKTVFPWI